MNKKALLTVLFLLLITSAVSASETDIEISSPQFYCYESSSNGHSAVNVIVINDEVILNIANLDESVLKKEFNVTDASNIHVQFDYSVGDDINWHHTKKWDPDRFGFYKSPLSLKFDADEGTLEGRILNLELDEYLDLVYDYTYKGSNDGWDDVFIYDFDTYPLYIRARFIYTLEDPDEGVYIPLVSGWSEAIKVSEHINVDSSLLSTPVVILKPYDVKNNNIVATLSFTDKTKELIGNLSHYDGEFSAEFMYAYDDGEFLPANAEDNDVSIGKDYILDIPADEEAFSLKIKAKITYGGNDRYGISSMDSGYSKEVSVLLKSVSSNPDQGPVPDNNTEQNHDPSGFFDTQKLILIIAVCAGVGFFTGILIGKKRKNKKR